MWLCVGGTCVVADSGNMGGRGSPIQGTTLGHLLPRGVLWSSVSSLGGGGGGGGLLCPEVLQVIIKNHTEFQYFLLSN